MELESEVTQSYPAPTYHLLGHRVALEFRPAERVYVAMAIDLPGYYARGATRTEVLRRRGEAIGTYHSCEASMASGSERRRIES